MLDNLKQELQINKEKYQEDNNLDNKQKLEEITKKIDKEYTKVYIENLKKYTKKENNIEKEATRIKNILNIMDKRDQERNQIIGLIQQCALEIELDNIPNLEKRNSFSTKQKIIETILKITTKLNKTNKEKALEILSRKEFKSVLLEFSLINNDTKEDIEKYLNLYIKENNDENSNKLKILNYYQENKKNFPNLNIPNMGLIKEKEEIEINNQSFFIN